MEEKLVIDVTRLDPEGETLEGEVDAVDVDEEFVHPFGGIRYRIDAQVLGTELLLRGRLEQDFDLVCSRCGKDFDTTVKVEDFTTSVEVTPEMQEVDLTAEVRDSILLTLPTYPVCEEGCPGIAQKKSEIRDERWSGLDSLVVR